MRILFILLLVEVYNISNYINIYLGISFEADRKNSDFILCVILFSFILVKKWKTAHPFVLFQLSIAV